MRTSQVAGLARFVHSVCPAYRMNIPFHRPITDAPIIASQFIVASLRMPPLSAPVEKDGSRRRHAAAAAAGRGAQRSASFHGGGAAEAEQVQRHLPKQRPRTQPDLLAGVKERSFRRDGDGAAVPAGGRPAPSKLLVTVAVLHSMWPLHVMARTGWRVADLVAAAVELYVREGRRPPLPSANPSVFGLHFSQFSLQSLDPEVKLVELWSRSFFLCPKAAATTTASASASSTFSSATAEADKATSSSASKPNTTVLPWLGLMHFWPLT